MSITKKQIKEFETIQKNEMYDAISEVNSEIVDLIIEAKDIGTYLGFDTNIPNIGITINNKVGELSQEFEQAGVSMYVEVDEEYDYIDTNSVGDAILIDLDQHLREALKELKEYEKKFRRLAQQKVAKIESLQKAGPIKKLFWNLRTWFLSEEEFVKGIFWAPKEVKEINSHLAKYRELDDKIFSYNLKDNLKESIIEYVREATTGEEVAHYLIDRYIGTTLKELGFESLVPEIKKEIHSENEEIPAQNRKSWEMSNWGMDAEDVRKEAAKASKVSEKNKKDKSAKELSERE